MIRLTRSAPPLVSSTITVSTGDNPLNSPTRPQEHAWTEPVLATPAQNSLSDLWTERRSIHHLITATPPEAQKQPRNTARASPSTSPPAPRARLPLAVALRPASLCRTASSNPPSPYPTPATNSPPPAATRRT